MDSEVQENKQIKLTKGEQNFLNKYFSNYQVGEINKHRIKSIFGEDMLLNTLGVKMYKWIIIISTIVNEEKLLIPKTLETYKVKSRAGLIKVFDQGRYLFMKLYSEYSEMVH